MLAIPPDFSFVIQIISFFILWMGLKRLVWDPMLANLEARESRTRGARKQADEMRSAADLNAAEYERRLQDVRAGMQGESQAARAAVESEERQILNNAREQASRELSQLRDHLGRQAETTRSGFAAQAESLAHDMMERIVGRPLA